MNRFSHFILAIAFLLLLGSASGRGSDDKIADDLEKAKTKFEADMKKLRADIQDDFDKRLTKARDKGDKKLVEKIKDEQKVFDMHGILASTANKDLKKRATEQGKLIEKAYSDAKKAYFKAKKDELAAAVEKEWKQVHMEGLIIIAERPELWIPLFNGNDLTGWEESQHAGEKNQGIWKVVDGAIQCDYKRKDDVPAIVRTKRKDFDNYHISLELFYSPGSLSRLQLRYTQGVGGHYNVVLSSGTRKMGSVDKASNTINWTLLKNATLASPPAKEWITVEVIAQGYSITTIINGEKAIEAIDKDKISITGDIAFFVNEEGSVVRLRNIKILPLPSPNIEKK